MAEKKSILFVCLGNICRSPMAHWVFKHLLKAQNKESAWNVDSCGTGQWHVGKPMDNRADAVLTKHEVPNAHTARQIKNADFSQYDYVVVMDRANLEDVKRLQSRVKGSASKIMFLGDYDPQGVQEVDDPYYSNHTEAFEICYQHVYRSCENLLKELENNKVIEAH